MDKNYEHQKHETEIYKLWENSGEFTPKITNRKSPITKPFCIIMPPPNASDPLHVGHARGHTIQDTLIRYHRMKGEVTLWLPGADHAGIETQFVFEKKLAKDNKSRFDYDRETFYKMVWDDVQKNRSTMETQAKSLGSSCDWTRNKFTLDPDIVKVVLKTFKDFYDQGYIYRGKRIVNYCPRCGTAFSQLEVNVVEREDDLYTLDYGNIKISTTRPETIFADVAVAVHPKDPRYKNLIGKRATIPLINREVPIIADSLVDKEFGTGALKITPGHDALDFEIGQKHKLQILSVIDENGRMTNTPAKYTGLKSAIARQQVIADLEESGKIVETKRITHTVGTCYRDKGIIEPVISDQWYLKVKDLTKLALKSMDSKKTVFAARKYEKIARHWLKNLNDWNISRQIVWGIQIPAFRCQKCLEWTITDGAIPDKCDGCGHEKLTQDPDTFDTWFSSGQWPYATLMTTKPGDFEYFYPTSVIETAYEIIPFWVIRMMMFGLYKTGKVPFENVLIHGLVRDKEGLKISKSKGNVIDPTLMINKYGADALRMGIIWGTLIETDIALSEEKIRGQRNFANKIWNISRFVFDKTNDQLSNSNFQIKKPKTKNSADVEILKQLNLTIKKVTRDLDRYRLSEAAEELYEFVWRKFADRYIENCKLRIGNSNADAEAAKQTLLYVLNVSLRLLHPFMPFVTETIWQMHKKHFDSPLLINASWPK